MSAFDCRIVVLNYNGEDLLRRCLPSIVEAARRSRRRCRVAVLDNQSVDESEAWTSGALPEVRFDKAPENRILFSYNDYMRSIEEPLVILLNNDIRVEPGFVDPLLDALEGDEVFFAAPQARDFDGERRYQGSLSKMHPRFGLLWGDARFPGHEAKIDRPSLTMQCGYGAFKRERFLELGGYDDLYFPGTVEDADLCFRAYRRGWTGLYVPSSVVYHMGQASFKKVYGTGRLRRMNRRNLYLFMWKNIRDPLILAEHALWVPLHLAKQLLSGQWDFLAGFADACVKLPDAIRRRKADTARAIRSDRQIFAISRSL